MSVHFHACTVPSRTPALVTS
ncbi:MAG: hypothetical protein GEU95_06940 [Rhizobiales bacterium]|nr:hypothetical protein [Hyphomicrobiales bacterium]